MTIKEKYSQFIPLQHLCVDRIIDYKLKNCSSSTVIMENIYRYYSEKYTLSIFPMFDDIKDYPVDEFDKILTLEILKNT